MTLIKIENTNQFGKLTLERLFEFEQKYRMRLPEDYRSFLLENNGGSPSPEIIDFIQHGDKQSDIVNNLYGIHNGEYWASLDWHIKMLEDRVPAGFLPIGDDPGGNFYLIGVAGEHSGKVYFWDHENEAQLHDTEPDLENMSFIANSFTEFLNKLHSNHYE
jgi:hypothetical protein